MEKNLKLLTELKKMEILMNRIGCKEIVKEAQEQDWTQYQEKQNQSRYDNIENDQEGGDDIELFQFTEAFIKIINGVEKTKTDLKDSAGSIFGGASENYYRKLSVVLNEFYRNTYKPIEEQYIKDSREDEMRRRKLYPQNYK